MTATLQKMVDLGPGWNRALGEELKKPYMEELAEFLKGERASGIEVYPPSSLVFNSFRQTPFEKVKVVIVGQDPYHGSGQAEGLCFSVPKDVPVPPSLRNIFKELNDDLGVPIPSSGHLIKWARQGVLLLNSTLTVRQGQAASHQGRGWERFTDAALHALVGRDVIFVLWGRFAREKVERVLEGHQPILLTAPHPSPLSAHSGFFGCHHFSKVNRHLEQMKKTPINWAL